MPNSPTKIHLLDDHTINQIAAGEVIENFSSVIKELIENSIDAGAKKIEIEIKGGGANLIRISDDGHGMHKDDLILAVQRHATSKIRQTQDLKSIETFGFRGEALASIASISKMTLTSKKKESPLAHALILEGGKIIKLTECQREMGTTIEVKSLFYNTPVRKKFLNSASVENQNIEKIFKQAALSCPNIALNLTIDDRQVFTLGQGEKIEGRIAYLFGYSIDSQFVYLDESEGDYTLMGWLSKPFFHKATRGDQFLFINKRAVVSSFISSCVSEGYSTRLQERRFPLFHLFLSCPPAAIDVNVHPQKREVRFTDEETIAKFVIEKINHALEKHSNSLASSSLYVSPLDNVQQLEIAPKIESIFSNTAPAVLKEEEQSYFAFLPSFSFIARIGKYALFQEEETFFLLDPTAAYRRVFYEKQKKSTFSPQVQTLLLPIVVELKRKAPSQEMFLQWETMGIYARLIGKNTISIDAIPIYLPFSEVETVIEDFMELSFRGEADSNAYLLKLCKRCIWNKKDKEEVSSLYNALLKCQERLWCPFGKKILMELSPEKLAKEFNE